MYVAFAIAVVSAVAVGVKDVNVKVRRAMLASSQDTGFGLVEQFRERPAVQDALNLVADVAVALLAVVPRPGPVGVDDHDITTVDADERGRLKLGAFGDTRHARTHPVV